MTYVLHYSMGGTIDALSYSEEKGEYPRNATLSGVNERSPRAIREIFANSATPLCLESTQICSKDSKRINEHDIENLISAITNATKHGKKPDRIIVTVGTDRMCQIAQEVKRHFQDKGISLPCPIVFTGSIWPLENDKKTDGWHNLTLAAFVGKPTLTGVFIAMNGLFADAGIVKKNMRKREFYINRPKRSCFVVRQNVTGAASENYQFD